MSDTPGTPTTALALPPQSPDPAPESDRRLVAFARTPDEMVAAQASLVAWADAKIARERADAKELEDNYRLAVERKWKHSTIKRHWQRAAERVSFWEKTRDALAAGYCMVPDLPVDVFAVRTTRETPSAKSTYDASYTRASANAPSDEASGCDASGEGRYVAPKLVTWPESGTYKDSGGRDVVWQRQHVSRHFADVDFPFVLAKTQVLDATAQAMAHKIFDDMGVLPGATHHAGPRPAVLPDPLVIGRVILPRCHGGQERRLCFVVAWFIDVRDLDAIR